MSFITDDFLLDSDYAKELYQGYAITPGIIDYHNHLNPQQIAEDHSWDNLTQLWLYEDHYKWRAMRSNGIPERYCTGDASDWEKFQAWAQTVPYLLRNPLYHWTHLELKRYFNIDSLLGPDTAEEIWNKGNQLLKTPEFTVRNILLRSNVKLICTTDDPVDDLRWHKQIAESDFEVKVLPTYRPDKALMVNQPDTFNNWFEKLEQSIDFKIENFEDFLKALKERHDYFHANGCRLSDHGLSRFYAADYSDTDFDRILTNVRAGIPATDEEDDQFKSCLLVHIGRWNHSRGWTQQFHYGPMRNNSTRLFQRIGPDAGTDSMGSPNTALEMSRYLDRLDCDNKLAKTIIYNLNPTDNYMVASMIGNFQDGTFPGKIQFGTGWWFADQKFGMEQQMEILSQLGLLSRFVGMLTDSRSFVSFTRHEYFRRILCNLLGNDMEKGLIPRDIKLVGRMVEDICFNNAANYFDFEL